MLEQYSSLFKVTLTERWYAICTLSVSQTLFLKIFFSSINLSFNSQIQFSCVQFALKNHLLSFTHILQSQNIHLIFLNGFYYLLKFCIFSSIFHPFLSCLYHMIIVILMTLSTISTSIICDFAMTESFFLLITCHFLALGTMEDRWLKNISF